MPELSSQIKHLNHFIVVERVAPTENRMIDFIDIEIANFFVFSVISVF